MGVQLCLFLFTFKRSSWRHILAKISTRHLSQNLKIQLEKKRTSRKKKKSNNDLIFKRKSGIKPKTKNPTRVKQWKKKTEKQHLKLCGRGRDKTEDRSDMCFQCVCVCVFIDCLRHISSPSSAYTFTSISMSIPWAEEPTNKHEGGSNQTAASGREMEKEDKRKRSSHQTGFVLFSYDRRW